MTATALIAFRKARGLSQHTAARSWGITSTTAWRWENEQRPVPLWIERMFERERPLVKKIEAQEREIADLLLQIHRMPDSRPERRPMAMVRMSARGGRRAARA